jgi:superoxide dismutase, Fe-Mn family
MYTLPALPYDYDSLSGHISGNIMRLHHDKHHQTYVDKLNQAIALHPDLGNQPIDTLLTDISALPEDIRLAVRNHGGGHYNHSLFWKMMSPDGGGEPAGQIRALIGSRYGSYQSFVDIFTASALNVFGSGWVWLQPDGEIITTANQDSPIVNGGSTPLLGLDVWEHAYYLDYKNARADYVNAWWDVVNWGYVEEVLKGTN